MKLVTSGSRPCCLEVVQCGQQLGRREMSGGAEDHEAAGVERVVLIHWNVRCPHSPVDAQTAHGVIGRQESCAMAGSSRLRRWSRLAGCCFARPALVVAASRAAPAERLPATGADLSRPRSSGISSGGYMAVQFHVAYSSLVMGVGVLAGGPYYCAQGSAWTALYNCMKPGTWTPLPSVDALTAQTDSLARSGKIDPTCQLCRRARVWLFTGTRDETVRPSGGRPCSRYYQSFPAAADRLRGRRKRGPCAWSRPTTAEICAATAPPYINDCDFDAAGALLAHLYGLLAAPRDPGPGQPAAVRPA